MSKCFHFSQQRCVLGFVVHATGIPKCPGELFSWARATMTSKSWQHGGKAPSCLCCLETEKRFQTAVKFPCGKMSRVLQSIRLASAGCSSQAGNRAALSASVVVCRRALLHLQQGDFHSHQRQVEEAGWVHWCPHVPLAGGRDLEALKPKVRKGGSLPSKTSAWPLVPVPGLANGSPNTLPGHSKSWSTWKAAGPTQSGLTKKGCGLSTVYN